METPDRTIEMVEEFHRKFGHPVLTVPTVPGAEMQRLRFDLVYEEAWEACTSSNLVSLADGLADLEYVVNGYFIVSGLQQYKAALLEEVHRSNMTKLCVSQEEAQEHIDNVLSKDPSVAGVFAMFPKQVGVDQWVIMRADGKALKGPRYEKPNIAAVLGV